MSPRSRRRAATALLVASLAGWPTTALTIARNEPPIVLGLSWLAITLTAADILTTTDVRKQQDNDDD